ncbi:hypothetical protein C7B65_21825 [Phormidesmis priestleyi ULC007]|uniref:Uncharacterized protein n=1 Tax=Phormidesmis priestleyi ULC007 TaxID=1920490 RepID=A0A2T1D772_9CYAN|nr:hypothetical protein C7B65_21825 [Phormidesmis priestleyi ULC007]PZO47174.1 MAG: hypothetical protein DCF14_20530 [Phormidesmis priestleyi]
MTLFICQMMIAATRTMAPQKTQSLSKVISSFIAINKNCRLSRFRRTFLSLNDKIAMNARSRA